MPGGGGAILRGLISDAVSRIARLDASTHAIEVIDYPHHEIHSGSHFFIKLFEDLTNAEVYKMVFVTPNTGEWGHLFFDYWHEKELEFTITEGIATEADGTPVTVFNNNRNSAHAATIVVTHTPTNPTGGTVIYSYRRGDGNKGGGEKRDEDEIPLKQNTKYLITVTNGSAVNCLWDFHFKWYEHEDKD